jgi:CRP-like cAMP-binding protein
MYFKQSDLFYNLDYEFVEKVMDQSIRQHQEAGDVLFREGDPARHFYTLIKGRIRLVIGDSGQVVHAVSHAGECFGWSALLGRSAYSASAECRQATDLMLIEAQPFTRIIDDDPVNGLLFMKHLAGMLGKRLLQNYRMASSMLSVDAVPSFGTGQVSESITDVT